MIRNTRNFTISINKEILEKWRNFCKERKLKSSSEVQKFLISMMTQNMLILSKEKENKQIKISIPIELENLLKEGWKPIKLE